MIRIHVNTEAYEAILASFANAPRRAVRSPKHGYFLWLDHMTADALTALRGPRESYSDVIIRLAKLEEVRR